MKNKIYYALKYFLNIIFSKLSVKIRLLNNNEVINEESILELLETSLLSSDYSIKDRYSFLSFNKIKTFERKNKIKFSRRVLVNKQSIKNDDYLKIFLNNILMKILMQNHSSLFKGKVIILINNILKGTNCFQNIYSNNDIFYFGANSFSSLNIKKNSKLMTFGLSGCVLLLLKSRNKNISSCYHFSNSKIYEEVMKIDLIKRVSEKDSFDVYILSNNPKHYINFLKKYKNIKNYFINKKENNHTYDVLINHNLDFKYVKDAERNIGLSKEYLYFKKKLFFKKI